MLLPLAWVSSPSVVALLLSCKNFGFCLLLSSQTYVVMKIDLMKILMKIFNENSFLGFERGISLKKANVGWL